MRWEMFLFVWAVPILAMMANIGRQRQLVNWERALAEREKALLASTAQRAVETQAIKTGPCHSMLDIIIIPLYGAADLYVAGGCGEPDGTMTIVRGRN